MLKKAKNLFLILVVSLLSNSNLSAQNFQYQFYYDGGIGLFYRDHLCNVNIDQRIHIHNPKYSWNLGIDFEYKFKKAIILDFGLKFLSLGGKDRNYTTFYSMVNNAPVGDIMDEIIISSYYLSIPLSVKFNYRKFDFLAGYQLLYSLGGSYEYNYGIVDGEIPVGTSFDMRKYKEQVKFSTWDSGLLFGVNYSVSDKIAIRLRNYLGLQHVTSDGDNSGFCRNNKQLTVGLQYTL